MKQLSLDFEGAQDWCYECNGSEPSIFKPLCKRHLDQLPEITREDFLAALEKGRQDREAYMQYIPMMPGRFV